MQAYLVLGDEKYLRAATNGLRMVQEQSYATGGWGPNEAFVEPAKDCLPRAWGTRSSFETPCGAYGQFKITRYLLRVTRDSRYGDSMEQVLYSTVAGAKPILPDGTSFTIPTTTTTTPRRSITKTNGPAVRELSRNSPLTMASAPTIRRKTAFTSISFFLLA